jgi:hypothetical protein
MKHSRSFKSYQSEGTTEGKYFKTKPPEWLLDKKNYNNKPFFIKRK